MVKIKDLIKSENVIKVYSGDTLASALTKLQTSHDAAFVFNEEDKYLGVINPYYCLIKSSYPGNAKVEHCLFHAPRIKKNYSISKLAQLMIESKIHYLPAFDEDERFIGMISVRNLFYHLADSPIFKISIKDVLQLKKQSVVTIFGDDFISKALDIFKTFKISKLIVVNKEMKIEGILSYYDLIAYLITPKEREHQGDRAGNKIGFTHLRVKNFAKSLVLTLSPEDLLCSALKLILEKRIGSVVIVNKEKHPVGIITTRDFLYLLIKRLDWTKIELISKNLSQKNRQIVGGFFNNLILWLKKIPDLAKAKLFVKEVKQGRLFKVVLSLIPRKGQPKVIKEEGKNLSKVLRKIKKD